MAGTLFSTTLAAYAYTKINFKWRDKLFLLQLMTMMLPPQVSMLPNFIIFRNLGLVDKHAALWVPSLLGDAFTIFLLRQFLISIPMELNESAFIDGAEHFKIYSRIILPLSKPILATVAIFTFINSWNNYEGPLIYIRTSKLYTIPIALQAMSTNSEAIHNAELMAATVLSVIPILLIFGAFQRYFVESVSVTGIKG
jgi:ABC-type sugar transport system, permease component